MCVFNLVLKQLTFSAVRMWFGRPFHKRGEIMENALWPYMYVTKMFLLSRCLIAYFPLERKPLFPGT